MQLRAASAHIAPGPPQPQPRFKQPQQRRHRIALRQLRRVRWQRCSRRLCARALGNEHAEVREARPNSTERPLHPLYSLRRDAQRVALPVKHRLPRRVDAVLQEDWDAAVQHCIFHAPTPSPARQDTAKLGARQHLAVPARLLVCDNHAALMSKMAE
eukprot:6199585-Pleurochrysis_carterae.AAC.4